MPTPPLDQLRKLADQVTPVSIPECYQRPEFRFCRVGYTKTGLQREIAKIEAMTAPAAQQTAASVLGKFKVPRGKGWQKEADGPQAEGWHTHDSERLLKWISAGGNYGICAGSEVESDGFTAHLFILDADDFATWKRAGFFDIVKPRTRVVMSSTNNKRHYYYWTDLVSTKAHEELPGLGHFKFFGSQVVGPGSLHPSGARYTLADGSAPAFVDAETLTLAILAATKAMMPSELDKVHACFAGKPNHAGRLKKNVEHLEEKARQAKVERVKKMQRQEAQAQSVPEHTGTCTGTDLLTRIRADARINPCLRILSASIPEMRRFEKAVSYQGKTGEGEHFLRRAWATALIKSGYTDIEIQSLAAGFDDYTEARTQQQLDSVRAWVTEKGGNYYPCREIGAYLPPEMCQGCSWSPPGSMADSAQAQGMGCSTDTGEQCTVEELIDTFKKWLYIKEDFNITAPFTGVIANFCEGSPDIIGIIGPSGSTKTEFIRALGETQNEYVYPVSTITEHTLVSGHKDSRDLVPQLKNRILAIKDLTSILSRKEDVRAAIFADFRELTDEYIRKEFGNGIAKEYRDVHSSILFASTNAIERYYSMYSNLGQRMIFIRPQNDPKEARKRASQNRGKQKEMRAELHAVTKKFIASMLQVKEKKGLPTTPDEIQEEMGILYDFLALARTAIHHDYRTGDMDELPEPEFPTRIANTIGRLMEVHALFYDRDAVDAEDMAFGCRIISDNIPSMRWKILKVLTKEWQHTSKISQLADLPNRSVKYHLDELVALKLAEKLLKDEVEDSMDHRFDYFKLSDLAFDAIEIYDTRVRIEGIIKEEQSKILDKLNILLSNPCVVSPPSQDTAKHVEPQTKVNDQCQGADDRGLKQFKDYMEKRTCCLCGRSFPYDLTPYFNNDHSGHICGNCHIGGVSVEPQKADTQQKLDQDQLD